jgi:hypothetical protein
VEAIMHESSGGTVVIEITPMSEKDVENEKLRQIARHSEKMNLPKEHSCPSDMEMVRGVDSILYDHMDDGELSMIFPMEKDMMSDGMEPKAMSNFKKDYSDYQRFGGDVVSMELDRDVGGQDVMSDNEMDDLLGFAMDGSSMMSSEEMMREAEAAMREQFGRTALSVMEGESDGVVSFSVDTPDMGRVRYMYDSTTGEGRVMRGE